MNITAVNYDIIFLIIIIGSTAFAVIRGGVAEILSISTWFIALWVMHHFGNNLAQFIPQSVTNTFIKSGIVFATAFIGVAIGMAVVKKICAKIIHSIGLGGLNYLIGAIFGIIRGALICAVIIIVLSMLNIDTAQEWRQAHLYPILEPIVDWLVHLIPDTTKF